MKRKPRLRAIKKALRKPDLYTPKEYERLMSGFYDELVRDELRKQNKRNKGFGYVERETSLGDSESGGDDGLRGESQQPKQSRQSKRSWFTKLLYQARSLVGLRASTHDGGD